MEDRPDVEIGYLRTIENRAWLRQGAILYEENSHSCSETRALS